MTPEELAEIVASEREAQEQYSQRMRVCVAAGCQSSGSLRVLDALKQEVKQRGLEKSCHVKGVGCMGLCSAGPLVSVEPLGILNQAVTPEDAAEIVSGALQGKGVPHLRCSTETPFFQRQQKIVLENAGLIDPERIEDYIAADGYSVLIDILTSAQPLEVLEQIMRSGLRGRGGAGYPTGTKWSTVAKAEGERKFVICNGDEGDPGAFMDRAVLESDPHRVLEGMAIAAYAVGASQGYVYVRAEYPLAVKNLKTALKQAERLGLLGNRICGTSFSFHIDIRLGAGAFVCGEETALLSSIEGKRGTPRPRPPYPAEDGLWGYPTLINNVETFANVPTIMRKGADWFSKIGTAKSKGTKVFALAGTVQNTGLIEVPMGISLRAIISEIGGGVPGGGRIKAVQTGGPSGGCIPEQQLDVPVDYESLAGVGSIMGSGGMIVMDAGSCMVDVAKYFMEFCMTESCGKCVPCRAGTAQLYDLLTHITAGTAKPEDLALLEELCDLVKHTSLCGLGQTAPNPVLSTLRYFRHEYMDHIEKKSCPAGVCKMPVEKEVTP
jgi:bidirectional [NiFe] hydrogenase diaphorase subunit